jgi:hypothetical protein
MFFGAIAFMLGFSGLLKAKGKIRDSDRPVPI